MDRSVSAVPTVISQRLRDSEPGLFTTPRTVRWLVGLGLANTGLVLTSRGVALALPITCHPSRAGLLARRSTIPPVGMPVSPALAP